MLDVLAVYCSGCRAANEVEKDWGRTTKSGGGDNVSFCLVWMRDRALNGL